MERRLLPREAEKSRKGSVRVAGRAVRDAGYGLGRRNRTCYGVVPGVIWSNIAITVSVETCHRLFAEKTQGFLEDWIGSKSNVVLKFRKRRAYH
jgi:hypothetical protein